MYKKGQFERLLTKVKMPMYLIKHHAMKINFDECMAFYIISLSTKWRWMVSFRPISFVPKGNSPVPFVQEAGWTPDPFLDP